MVTTRQWAASKAYAIGLAFLLLAFTLLEIVSYVQFRAQVRRNDDIVKSIEQQHAVVKKLAEGNTKAIQNLSSVVDGATSQMALTTKELKACASCHQHEGPGFPILPRKKEK